jgi:hypothetical protein
LLTYRELDSPLDLTATTVECRADARSGKNGPRSVQEAVNALVRTGAIAGEFILPE